MQELERLEAALTDGLASGPDERQLVRLLKAAGILQDLVQLRLSRERLAFYRSHPGLFQPEPFLELLDRQRLLTPALRERVASILASLDTAKQFYTLAFSRMEQHQQSAALLVAGGFHTGGITMRLKERGIAYAVLAPTFEGEMDESLYASLLHHNVPAICLNTSSSGTQGCARRYHPSLYHHGTFPH